jgi:hypothetical protein
LAPVLAEGPKVEPAVPAPQVPPVEVTTVPAEPLAALAPSIGEEDRQAAPPMLTIEIGRIDVRVVAPAPPPAVREVRPKPLSERVPSLADYLSGRSEAAR